MMISAIEFLNTIDELKDWQGSGKYNDELTIRRNILLVNHQTCLLITEYNKEEVLKRKNYLDEQLKILGRKRLELDEELIKAKKEQKIVSRQLVWISWKKIIEPYDISNIKYISCATLPKIKKYFGSTSFNYIKYFPDYELKKAGIQERAIKIINNTSKKHDKIYYIARLKELFNEKIIDRFHTESKEELYEKIYDWTQKYPNSNLHNTKFFENFIIDKKIKEDKLKADIERNKRVYYENGKRKLKKVITSNRKNLKCQKCQKLRNKLFLDESKDRHICKKCMQNLLQCFRCRKKVQELFYDELIDRLVCEDCKKKSENKIKANEM